MNTTYIHAGLLIDGNGQFFTQKTIQIVDNLIKDIQPTATCKIPSNAEVIDAQEFTVMPGMIDCHVHIHTPGGPYENYAMAGLTKYQGELALLSYANAIKDLEMGFTSVRSLASPAYVDVSLRNTINSGLLLGPRIRAAGQGISVTGGHMDKAEWNPDVFVSGRTGVGDGPWGCRRAAREQIKRGADVIKINACGGSLYDLQNPWHQEMTLEEMTAVVEEAHWANIRVSAHTSGGPGLTDALKAGIDSVEHGQWLSDEQIELMIANGVFYIPTLITNTRGIEMGQEALQSSDEEWAWLTKTENDKWDSLARAKKAGVKIAVGTDAGFWLYHGENAAELNEFVTKGGFSPMEAIIAATRTGAECLDIEKITGTIEPGKCADLVVVNGNPLEDITLLQEKANIKQVFINGKKVKNN